MEILVTGHKGFIGTEVYAKLKADGYNVTGMDIGDPLPDTTFDYIIHLGARTLIRKSKELPYEYFEDNVGYRTVFDTVLSILQTVFYLENTGLSLR